MICAFKKPGRAQPMPLTYLTFKKHAEYLEQLTIIHEKKKKKEFHPSVKI